jgi:mRNA interferase RelE/StbE
VSAGYRVEIARRALKSIQTLPKKEQQRVRAAIELLADTPRPPGCVALKGESSAYRVRVGDYRVVYEIHDARLLIQVVRVGHRRQVYR